VNAGGALESTFAIPTSSGIFAQCRVREALAR
jgi:hypothetical protein